MERTTLSSNQILLKVMMVIFGGIFIAIAFTDWRILIFGFFGELYMGYRAFFAGDKIQFDRNHMYIVYKDGETPVELKNVFYAARITAGGGGMGKIKYYYEGQEYYTRFFPRYFSRAFSQFVDDVVAKNPNATIYRQWGF
jgi:hypothetical protein